MWWAGSKAKISDANEIQTDRNMINDDKVELLCPRESLMKTEEETCKSRRPIKIAVQSKVKIQNLNVKKCWPTSVKSCGQCQKA